MIEINLLDDKKTFHMPSILGLNLSSFNIPFLLFALIFTIVPENFIYGIWEKKLEENNKKLIILKNQSRNLSKQSKGKQDVISKIETFEAKVNELNEKLAVVKKILKTKKNPREILKYLAEQIPQDVWLNELIIEKNEITVKGFSSSYKSIGLFIENLRQSVFFDSTLRLLDSKTIEDKEGIRVEEFQINGLINRFNN